MREIAFHQPDTAAMERLLAAHPEDRAGVVLRLAWLVGLTRDEIVSLVWDNVAFDAGVVRIAGREAPLDVETARCLRAWEREKSSPPHELLVAICRRYGVSADYLLGLTDVDPAYVRRRRLEYFGAEELRALREFEDFLYWRRHRRRAEEDALDAVLRTEDRYTDGKGPVHAE